ncbi:hypothetical protein ZWY2020_059071 [Hordeum vulgare]|nr:hypothetical protein ZWY2020_059071 [Hordeum vulgare]
MSASTPQSRPDPTAVRGQSRAINGNKGMGTEPTTSGPRGDSGTTYEPAAEPQQRRQDPEAIGTLDLPRIPATRVEKIDAQRKTTTASVHGVAGTVAKLGGIDAAAAEYIRKVHERLAAEEAAAAATAAARRQIARRS